MTTKQLTGTRSEDGSQYVCVTDGAGNLLTMTTTAGSGTKGVGIQVPDGSKYITVTDGNGNLT